MAFGAGTNLNTSTQKSATTSITLTFATSITAGTEFIVAILAKDNTSTTAGDNSEVTSVTDTKGNTWTKIKEQTNAGSAAAACTISMWMCSPTTSLTNTDSVTFNFASCTAKVLACCKFGKASNSTIEVGATNSATADGAVTGQSLSVTPPDNREWLFIRGEVGEETSANGAMWANTSTTNWTAFETAQSTTGGGAASNIYFAAEYRIMTTGSAQASNPGDGNLPSCDQASVICCLKETVSGPVIGRADETDTAFKAGGIAMALQRANETDTASAIFPKVVKAVGQANETDTAFRTAVAMGVNRSNETDSAFALSQGIIQLPTGQATETDTAFKAGGIAMAPNLPIETDSAFNRGTVLQPQRANEADTAFARPQLGGVGLAIETDTALALGKVFIKQVGFVSVANGNFDSNYLSEFATFDATIAVVAGRLRVTAQQASNIQATATYPSIGAALRVGNIVKVSGQSFSGTAPATIRLGNGASNAPGQPYLNTSFNVETVLTNTSVKIDCSLNDMSAVTIGQYGEFDNLVITEIPLEVDTAFALARLDTPAWTQSNEIDSAFALVTGFPVVRSNETDSAFARTAIFIRAVTRSDEVDTAFARTAIVIRPVGFISETDTALRTGIGLPTQRANEVSSAFARNALVVYDVGRADEFDTAFQMFGALEAGSGRKPYVKGNESILRHRIQPVHKVL